MPLPKREQRILQQIERTLAAEDPAFASHMTARSARLRRVRLLRIRRGLHRHAGASLLLAGLALLALGAVTGWFLLIAFAAVALMIGCVRAV